MRVNFFNKSGLRARKFACLLGLLFSAAASSAHATTNYVGWVLANQPDATAPYTPDPHYSFSSVSSANLVEPQGNGLYYIGFDSLNLGVANNNAPDDVQVSAYNTSGWCVLIGWSGAPGDRGSVLAKVQCFDRNGNRANTEFTVLYQSRGAPFGSAREGIAYVEGDQTTVTGTYTATKSESFDSAGGSNSITNSGPKPTTLGYSHYTVTIPGLNKVGGNVQVTPVLYRGRCKPVSWGVTSGGATADVQCYNYLGIPAPSLFTTAYSVGEPLGVTPGVDPLGAYVFANDLSSTNVYTPMLSHQYNGFRTGNLTAQKTGTGLYTVTIPGTLNYATSTALVSATGTGNAYCNLAGWTGGTINVACYGQGGGLTDSRFELTFQTANRAGR